MAFIYLKVIGALLLVSGVLNLVFLFKKAPPSLERFLIRHFAGSKGRALMSILPEKLGPVIVQAVLGLLFLVLSADLLLNTGILAGPW